jgi:hypothetical protein
MEESIETLHESSWYEAKLTKEKSDGKEAMKEAASWFANLVQAELSKISSLVDGKDDNQ